MKNLILFQGTGGSVSCNTSPVSTLTGSSDAAAGVGASQHGEPSSESIGSLLSVSGHSTASSSHQRRHSLTGEYNLLKKIRNY
jgi:hypothetical protein